MNDPRIRLASVILLSCAAFASIETAIASILWILIFSDRRFRVPSVPAFLGLFVMISIISVISWNEESGGISYFIRMGTLLNIALWAYSEIKPGEILDTLVWLLGEKTGFELGLAAEIAMTEIRRIPTDFRMAQIAMRLKGEKLGIINYIPVLGNILIIALRRAEEHGKILAVRGYFKGGTHNYKFYTEKKDYIAIILAFIILLGVFLPLVKYL